MIFEHAPMIGGLERKGFQPRGSLSSHVRAGSIGKLSFGLTKFVREITPTKFSQPPADNYPTAKSLQAIPPSPIPSPPSPPDIVQVKQKYREGKNIQPNMKHVPKSIETSHNHLDRLMHFFWSHRIVGNKEWKITIIILPSKTSFGKDSVFLFEPLGELRTRDGDWQ